MLFISLFLPVISNEIIFGYFHIYEKDIGMDFSTSYSEHVVTIYW